MGRRREHFVYVCLVEDEEHGEMCKADLWPLRGPPEESDSRGVAGQGTSVGTVVG